MAIKWRSSLRDGLKRFMQPARNFGREFAVKAGLPEHTIAVLAAALVFFCIELIIEQWLFDNDFIVDLLGATTGALAILLLRFAAVNSRLYRNLRESSETLERRVSEIAHEFQTPIAILKGNLGILADAPSPPYDTLEAAERAGILQTASTTLDRLSRLVRTLLDVAKLGAPNHAITYELLNANALAQEICEDCSLLAQDRGIVISFGASEKAASIMANRDQMKEVLLNLLGNALKYTPRGGTISVEVARANGFVEIAVADTGCGIAPENLAHVFDRFYRIADGESGGAAGCDPLISILARVFHLFKNVLTRRDCTPEFDKL